MAKLGNEVGDVSGLMPILSAQTYELSDNPEWLSVINKNKFY